MLANQIRPTYNTLCRYCFQVHPFLAKKAPGTPVFGHCPKLNGVWLMLFRLVKRKRTAVAQEGSSDLLIDVPSEIIVVVVV